MTPSSGPSDRPVVRAAGGVVWRRRSGELQVLVVHRPPPRNDWSLPKGKLEDGERHRDAALREVHEETGMRCALGDRLTEISYATPKGEDKRVRWWAMTVEHDDGFTPNREIDDRRWVTTSEAAALLTWGTDRSLLQLFMDSDVTR